MVWQGCAPYWRLWGESASRVIERVGGYHFHVVAGLRSWSHFWLLVMAILSFERPPSFLGSWLPSSVFKASNGSLSPYHARDLSEHPFQLLCPLPPSSSTSLCLIPLPSSSAFQGPCDYIRLNWIIQDTPYFKVSWLVTLISSAKSLHSSA